MAKCSVCSSMMVGGYSDGGLSYCSLHCLTQSTLGDFCEECLAQTTEDSPGSTLTINFFGTKMSGASGRCNTCHSVVQGKWLQILFPVFCMGNYRVLYNGSKYVGRLLKDQT